MPSHRLHQSENDNTALEFLDKETILIHLSDKADLRDTGDPHRVFDSKLGHSGVAEGGK